MLKNICVNLPKNIIPTKTLVNIGSTNNQNGKFTFTDARKGGTTTGIGVANAATGLFDAAKARALFTGMFERKQNNVQKGRFGQALAQAFSEPGAACVVPEYIRAAIVHACQLAPAKP